MYRYRETPERTRQLDDLQRAWDAHHPEGKPAPGITGLELQFHEEDTIIQEFGRLMVFDWTVSDEAGRTEKIRSVSAETEAVVQAFDRWDRMEYKPKGRVARTRDDSTAAPAATQPYTYDGSALPERV
jgi:hypothetical protein